MTDDTPNIEGFSFDDHIACLRWSDEATEHEKTLVIGNLRTLYADIARHLAVCRKPPEDCQHDWRLPDGVTEEESQQAEWPLEYCSKCGMSLVRHIFTECP